MIEALTIGASVALSTVALHRISVAIISEEINPNARETTMFDFEAEQCRTSAISLSGEQINCPSVLYAQVKKPGPGKSGPGKAGVGQIRRGPKASGVKATATEGTS